MALITVLLIPKGVLQIPKGVLSSSKGVLPSPTGVLLIPEGVLPNPKGVLSSPKGVLLIPKKCCLIKTAQSFHRIYKSKCKTAVLVAIAIPVFTNQLEKSREATDLANVRSAYAEVMTQYLEDGEAASMTVTAQQKVSGWQTSPQPTLMTQINGSESALSFAAKTSGTYSVVLAVNESGVVTVSVS